MFVLLKNNGCASPGKARVALREILMQAIWLASSSDQPAGAGRTGVEGLRARCPLASITGTSRRGPIGQEPFELLDLRGLLGGRRHHPTAFDPDQAAWPAGAELESADLLQGPLNPRVRQTVGGASDAGMPCWCPPSLAFRAGETSKGC